MLGSAASGFLQLAINFTNLIAHPTSMLYQATFPELSRMAAGGDQKRMRKVALRSCVTGVLIASPFILGFALLREPLAAVLGGPEFLPAAPLIALMALAQAVRIGSVVFEAAVVSSGGAGCALAAQTASAALSLAALGFALPLFGVAAAPAAIIAGWAILVALYLLALYRPK
jgi:O-antigen/teichoic acid export membrane protein